MSQKDENKIYQDIESKGGLRLSLACSFSLSYESKPILTGDDAFRHKVWYY